MVHTRTEMEKERERRTDYDCGGRGLSGGGVGMAAHPLPVAAGFLNLEWTGRGGWALGASVIEGPLLPPAERAAERGRVGRETGALPVAGLKRGGSGARGRGADPTRRLLIRFVDLRL